jgi:hypothetical protein
MAKRDRCIPAALAKAKKIALTGVSKFTNNCSDYGGCIHTDVTIFIVSLGNTDSTAMLSYSQRHYDI